MRRQPATSTLAHGGFLRALAGLDTWCLADGRKVGGASRGYRGEPNAARTSARGAAARPITTGQAATAGSAAYQRDGAARAARGTAATCSAACRTG